jgi:RNA polymerase sigma-70 factor, ECF subfamily
MYSEAMTAVGYGSGSIRARTCSSVRWSQRDDDDLIRECARGETQALEELVARYEKPIYRFVFRLVSSPEDAEEAALEVFVRLWRYAGRFEFRSTVSTWLYRVAANLARDVRHRRRANPETAWPIGLDPLGGPTADTETDAIVDLERQERSRDVHRALARLGASDRLILVLYYLEERSYADIEAITGCSYSTLKTRLARARRRLRDQLGGIGLTGGTASPDTRRG